MIVFEMCVPMRSSCVRHSLYTLYIVGYLCVKYLSLPPWNFNSRTFLSSNSSRWGRCQTYYSNSSSIPACCFSLTLQQKPYITDVCWLPTPCGGYRGLRFRFQFSSRIWNPQSSKFQRIFLDVIWADLLVIRYDVI